MKCPIGCIFHLFRSQRSCLRLKVVKSRPAQSAGKATSFLSETEQKTGFLAEVIFRGIYLKVCIYTDINDNKKVIFWKAKKKTKEPPTTSRKE